MALNHGEYPHIGPVGAIVLLLGLATYVVVLVLGVLPLVHLL